MPFTQEAYSRMFPSPFGGGARARSIFDPVEPEPIPEYLSPFFGEDYVQGRLADEKRDAIARAFIEGGAALGSNLQDPLGSLMGAGVAAAEPLLDYRERERELPEQAALARYETEGTQLGRAGERSQLETGATTRLGQATQQAYTEALIAEALERGKPLDDAFAELERNGIYLTPEQKAEFATGIKPQSNRMEETVAALEARLGRALTEEELLRVYGVGGQAAGALGPAEMARARQDAMAWVTNNYDTENMTPEQVRQLADEYVQWVTGMTAEAPEPVEGVTREAFLTAFGENPQLARQNLESLVDAGQLSRAEADAWLVAAGASPVAAPGASPAGPVDPRFGEGGLLGPARRFYGLDQPPLTPEEIVEQERRLREGG